jgi:hypothetical protein
MTMQTETPANEVVVVAAPADTNAAPATAAPASAAPAEGAADAGTTEATTAPANDSSGTQEPERKDNGQYKSGVQKRIDTLVFQRQQSEREVERLHQVIADLKQPAAPKLADFDSHDEYDQAMLEHRIESGVNKGLVKSAQAQVEQLSTAAQTAAAETYNQRVADTVTRIPDFVDVVKSSTAKMSPQLHEALLDSDKGPELVYHLAKNPGEADRLNNMSVRQMDREIGRLESTFADTKPAPAPKPPPARTTNAPPPITPGSQASAPANTDPNKMNQVEFEAWAKANGSRYIR